MEFHLDQRMLLIEKEVSFVAVRSRGPGGQNVNKVSSAAQCFWDYQRSSYLSFDEKILITQKLSNLINFRGELYLRSDEFRDLPRNKENCLRKLRKHLEIAFHQNKARKPSRPTRSSKLKKKETKQKRADLKSSRKKITA